MHIEKKINHTEKKMHTGKKMHAGKKQHIETRINKVKEFLLWIYIMAILTGIVYAVHMGQQTKNPGEIIYERTHAFVPNTIECSK